MKARSFKPTGMQKGFWDICYYIWLKVTIGWPTSWLEWDVLFLIPWIWLGPWICPVLISILFIVWGAWALQSDATHSFSRTSRVLLLCGGLLTLASFVQPAVPALIESGSEGLPQFVPERFWWGLFIPGYLLMLVGFVRDLWTRT